MILAFKMDLKQSRTILGSHHWHPKEWLSVIRLVRIIRHIFIKCCKDGQTGRKELTTSPGDAPPKAWTSYLLSNCIFPELLETAEDFDICKAGMTMV
jgi:hypothetical protein